MNGEDECATNEWILHFIFIMMKNWHQFNEAQINLDAKNQEKVKRKKFDLDNLLEFIRVNQH